MDLKSLKEIPASFALAKRALLFCLIIASLVSIGSLVWAYVTTNNIKNTAYMITQEGQAALMHSVSSSVIDTYREPEIVNHIKMFHDYFWEIDQFNYERRIDNALYLAGESGRRLYQTLEASGHFANLRTENLIQKLEIDSIKVNDRATPYQGEFYGKLRILRTDQKLESVNTITANFVLYNVARTDRNPHGLLIENYSLESQYLIKNN